MRIGRITNTEAIEHLTAIATAIQRYRSIARDTEDDPSILASINKWIWDDSWCPLLAITRIVDRGTVGAQQFFNLLFLVTEKMPEVMLTNPSHKLPTLMWYQIDNE